MLSWCWAKKISQRVLNGAYRNYNIIKQAVKKSQKCRRKYEKRTLYFLGEEQCSFFSRYMRDSPKCTKQVGIA